MKTSSERPLGEIHNGGFEALVHTLKVKPDDIEEVGSKIALSLLHGFILTEHADYGTILITPDRADVYIVPPEVIVWMVQNELIVAAPTHGGAGTARLQ